MEQRRIDDWESVDIGTTEQRRQAVENLKARYGHHSVVDRVTFCHAVRMASSTKMVGPQTRLPGAKIV